MPAQLALDGRQLVHEEDLARHLLIREHLGGVLADLGLELLRSRGPGAEHDERAHELAAALQVAHAYDPAGRDGRVAAEHLLDLVRAEGAAARRDHVLGAPDEGDESLLVHHRDVAGDVPVAAERALRLLGRLPVAGEQGRRTPAHGQVALDTGRKLVALVVDDPDVVAGQRAPDRAGLRGTVGRIRDDEVRLRLSVAGVNRHAPALLECLDRVRVEVLAGRHEPP